MSQDNIKYFWPENLQMQNQYEKMVEKIIQSLMNNAISELLEKNMESIQTDGIELGRGRTAVVSVLKNHPKVCLKIISDKTISTNRAKTEMDFLIAMKKQKNSVPLPICAIETANNDYLLMETISGFSVKDLIEKNLFSAIPPKFNFYLFFEKLKQLVKNMHDEQIHHRDLHDGNVMIDENGEPVIIDFGDATRIYLSSENPYKETQKGKNILYGKDDEKIITLRNKLAEYLFKKDYFKKKGEK